MGKRRERAELRGERGDERGNEADRRSRGRRQWRGKEGGAGESAWTGRGLERRKGGQMGEEEVDAWGQNARSDSEGQRYRAGGRGERRVARRGMGGASRKVGNNAGRGEG